MRDRLTDFTGADIAANSRIVYSARRGNRVRMAEGIVLETYTDRSAGRVTPMLRVQPTGRESGFVRRRTQRIVNVGAEHVVVIG